MSERAQQGLDPDQLAAILKREYEAADKFHGELETLQKAAFEYYEAQPFGNEIEGRSQVVLPDVQETADYMLQSVLRTFVSGDRVVEFEATDEQDEQAADDATAAVDYVFMRKQDGYRALNDGAMDGLLRKIGIFKAGVEEEEKVTRQRVTVDPLQIGEMPEGIEVENLTENEDGTVTALVKTQRIEKRYIVEAVPTGEFRFSPRARHEDTADYIAHVRAVTRSELVEMGFDRDQVYALPKHDCLANKSESRNLDSFRDADTQPELEEVLLCEEYARIDVDGDGIAERVKCHRVENEILIADGEPSIETVDEQPFAVFCPFPRPHRLVGYSLADKVMDLQLARSFVARQLFDGLALSNMPRPVVAENGSSDETLDDILNPIPGSPIRVQDINAVQFPQQGFDVGKSLTVMEWITGERESRTGITRLNQGLDADALNKTATGTALMQSQGQQVEEYIARNLAETVSRVFAKLYRLMRVDGEPMQIRVDGKYRQIDPAMWPDDMNIRVRVGLGSGSKDKRVQARMALLEPLTMAIEQGMSSQEHAFKWFDGMARDTGIGQGEDFIFDPSSEEGQANAQAQAEKPDPEMQAKQAELQLKGQEAGAKIGLEREKAGAQIDVMREKHALEMQLAREKAAEEAQLARERMIMEAQLEDQRMRMDAQHKAKMEENRPGGSLNA